MPGFQFIEVPAGADCPALKGAMWYPCAAPPGDIDLGEITAKFGFTLRGAKDCPISGDKLPLVVISLGRGAYFLGHYDLAETLAARTHLVHVQARTRPAQVGSTGTLRAPASPDS